MSATPPEERRLTPTERLHEVTLAALARRPAEPEHTIDLSRNAKGAVQFGVAVRGPDLATVLADALATFDTLNSRYPYTSNGGE